MDARCCPTASRCDPALSRPEDVAEREEFFRLGLAGRHGEVKARMDAAMTTIQARIDMRRLARMTA